jgi:predicted AAA+ superfamily ATPase
MSIYSEPLPRLLAPTVEHRLARFPVVVVTGARQAGKTTLVQRIAGAASRRFFSLDSLSSLDQALQEPEVIVSSQIPITIDEVQRAPDLLLAVKAEIDRDRRPGRFLLTGSANLLLLKTVSESLAGRAIYVELRPFTTRERRGDTVEAYWTRLLKAKTPEDALAALPEPRRLDWRKAVLEGGFPRAALAADPEERRIWFEGFVDTYVKRDVRDLAQVGDLAAFTRFLKFASLRTGGLLNVSEIGRDAGLSRSTAERWLSILQASFLVNLLEPFFESQSKRIIKTPKLYSADAGLGLFLAGVLDEDGLSSLPNSAVWLEALVLNDLLAWRETEAAKPGVFYRRTAGGEEVDFVIEGGRRLLPIELKASRAVRVDDARAVDRFCEEFPGRAPFGVLLHDGSEARRLTSRTIAVPLGSIL